jgi:hypothetical protein
MDINLVLVGGFERGTDWHFDLCRADLLPFVEQFFERGMHLLDGLVLEEGCRVMPLLVRAVSNLDAYMGLRGSAAGQLEPLLLLEHLRRVLVHPLRPY